MATGGYTQLLWVALAPRVPLKVSGTFMGLGWMQAPVTQATPAVRGIVSDWDWHSRVAAERNKSPIPSCPCLSPHHRRPHQEPKPRA